MAFVNDEARDQGLDWVDTNGTRIDICSQEPTTYAEATSTYTLGNDTVNTGATQDEDSSPSNGRMVQVPAITAGTVTATGTATHWALTDSSSQLVATGALSSSVSVVAGKAFSLDAINIITRDAT